MNLLGLWEKWSAISRQNDERRKTSSWVADGSAVARLNARPTEALRGSPFQASGSWLSVLSLINIDNSWLDVNSSSRPHYACKNPTSSHYSHRHLRTRLHHWFCSPASSSSCSIFNRNSKLPYVRYQKHSIPQLHLPLFFCPQSSCLRFF